MTNIMSERYAIHRTGKVDVGEDHADSRLAVKNFDSLFRRLSVKDLKASLFKRLSDIHPYHKLVLDNEHDASVPAVRHGHTSGCVGLRGDPEWFFIVRFSAGWL